MVKFIDFNLVSSIVAGDYFVGHNASSNGELRATAQNIASDFATMIRPTWAQSLTDFRGIDLDVTNTASGAGSLLMRLAVGGVDKFTVDLDGNLSTSGDFSIGSPLVLDGNTSLTNDGSTIELGDNALTETHLFGNVGIGTASPNAEGYSTGAYLDIGGDRGTLLLTSTAADAADVLVGKMMGNYRTNSANYEDIADVTFWTEGATANQRGGNIRFRTSADGSSGIAERMRINSSGNVGIGTTSPNDLLHVSWGSFGGTDLSLDSFVLESGTNAALSFNSPGTTVQSIYFRDDADTASGASAWMRYSHSSDLMTFRVAGSDALAIDSSGNVGIGTTSPTELLDVNSDSFRLRSSQTPASASATGTQGQICWDANYLYVCTATDTWKRAALATW